MQNEKGKKRATKEIQIRREGDKQQGLRARKGKGKNQKKGIEKGQKEKIRQEKPYK